MYINKNKLLANQAKTHYNYIIKFKVGNILKRILVIDAQGGGIGKSLVSAIKENKKDVWVTAVGTNSAATSAMLKAGADEGATGENAATVCAKKADIIVGPIGIVIANSLLGEITPKIALSVATSNAKRILLPFNHCDNIIVGIKDFNIGKLIQNAVEEINKLI